MLCPGQWIVDAGDTPQPGLSGCFLRACFPWLSRCHPSTFCPSFKPNGVSPETRMVCPRAANGSRTHRCQKATKHSLASGATNLFFTPSFRPVVCPLVNLPWSIRTPFVGQVDDAERHHCENSDTRGPLVPRTPSNRTRWRLLLGRHHRSIADWQRPVPASNAIARAGKLSRISLAAMFSPRFNRRARPR